jgi:tRNA(fMet)-specific endonuclease VapC
VGPRYLIDTDIFIFMRQRRPPQVRARFERLKPGEAVVSVIVYGELLYGAQKSANRPAAMKGIEELIGLTPVSPMSAEVASEYAVIRATLEMAGEIIGNNDLWIAAHARAAGLVLVTNNEREFRRVPGLKLENWVA